MKSKKAIGLSMSFAIPLLIAVILIFVVSGTFFSADAQESTNNLIKVPGQQFDELTSDLDFSLSDILELDFERDSAGAFRESSATRTIDSIGDLSNINLRDTSFDISQNKANLPSYTQTTYEKIETLELERGTGIDYLEIAAREEGISPLLVFLVATRESRGDPNAVSGTGAAGLTQFTSGTAQSFSSIFGKITPCCTASEARRWACNEPSVQECNVDNDDRFDPAKSLDAASKYLAGLVYTYDDLILVLTAYNAGPAVSNRCKSEGTQEGVIDCVLEETESIHNSQKEEELRGYLSEIAGDYAEIINNQETFS